MGTERLRSQSTPQLDQFFKTTMKVVIIALVCLSVALAQQHHNNQHPDQHQNQHQDALMNMIHMEVQALLKDYPGMTSTDCEKMCDSMFGLMDNHDETVTDNYCKGACQCDIDHNCGMWTTETTANTSNNNTS